MKKNIKLGVIIAIALIILFYTFYTINTPMKIDTLTVELSDGGVYFIEKGIVKPNEEKLIYSQVNGSIKNILVNEKDTVNKGDILVEVDSSDIDFQIKSLESIISGYEIQKESLDVENYKNIIALENSKKELESQLLILKSKENQDEQSEKTQIDIQKVITEQALIQYENAKEELEKNTVLYENGIISKSKYDEIENYMKNSKDEYEKARLQLENIKTLGADYSQEYYNNTYNSIKSQIQGIDKQISLSSTDTNKKYYDTLINNSKISMNQLINSKSKYSITAMYDGVIKSIEIKNTNVVNTVSPIIVMENDDNDIIESYVSTRDINSVHIGDEVDLIFKNRDGDITIGGIVLEISNEAISKVSSLGVDERAVLVKIEPRNNEILKKGYEVDVKYELVNGENTIVVPVTAVYKKGDIDMVMAVVDGVVEEREVNLGHKLIAGFVIESGLEVNDEIIVDVGTKGLKAGIKVKKSN